MMDWILILLLVAALWRARLLGVVVGLIWIVLG